MKTIFLTLILTLVFGSIVSANAQTERTLKVRLNRQKSFAPGNLTIAFVSLVEDSRCPVGTDCIWAGNAKIKVKVSQRGGASKIFEMNTNVGPKGDIFEGYAINLVELTPVPQSNVKIDQNSYEAVFSISRLTR